MTGMQSRPGPDRAKGIRTAFAAISVLAFGIEDARTQEAKPDKSGYSILNPTPPELLRDFSTDRPTRANIPYTIDAGQYQVESDLGFHTRDDTSRANQRNWSIASPIFKVGLTSDIQLDLVFSGLYNHTELKDRRRGTSRESDGFGDVSLRGKVNLWGNDGGDTAFAVMPYVKLPTNSGNVGNNQVEGGLFAPFAASLPLGFTMIVMPQIAMQKDVGGNGKHAHFSQLVNFNRPIVETVTGYIEAYAEESAERGVPNFYTLDLGLAWGFAPDWQLDGGTNIGLNKAAPDLQAYFGLSHRF
jgi:hypothetical protein